LVYKYKTEVKLSVANGQYDLKNEITADVNIKSLGHCNYALQVRIFGSKKVSSKFRVYEFLVFQEIAACNSMLFFLSNQK